MTFPTKFIAAAERYCTLFKHYPAPYLRKDIELPKVKSASLIICGLGFYKLYINGTDITKGHMSPYISNPDHIVYYDSYDISKYLVEGKNTIGVVLGNGMQNPLGGAVWDFDKAAWRGVPKLALEMNVKCADGSNITLTADESFKVHASPITFDDMRCGEFYDARAEIAGWNAPGFNDSGWASALSTETPKGEPRLCEVGVIAATHKLAPVNITEYDGGYLYDFGINAAGVCMLSVNGNPGQAITMVHGEHLVDGKLNMRNIGFDSKGFEYYDDFNQKAMYTCKGGADIEKYMPSFTYFGFQYVYVTGIMAEQATKELLTYHVMNSTMDEVGDFSCSNNKINTLQRLTRRSTLANFYHIVTDCPHREKNGWTADAALSAEHILLNLDAGDHFKEWMYSIRKEQQADGALPGIVPTGGWGYDWCNGPAWDSVLIYLPYFTYIYRGDTEIIAQNAEAIYKYLKHLKGKQNEQGLLCFGLGDWCTPGREAGYTIAPLVVTDSIISLDICNKATEIFEALDMREYAKYANDFAIELRWNIRKHLVDFNAMAAYGNCQTSQAMILYYDILEEHEKPAAVKKLVELIAADNNKMITGVLGARVIFHVLSEHGYGDLAFEMITTSDFPSYGHWLELGATSLWEDFRTEKVKVNSLNHHFFGDISNWFISKIAGIRVNPNCNNIREIDIRPCFIGALNDAQAFHILPGGIGRIESAWRRTKSGIELIVATQGDISGTIALPAGYAFADGNDTKPTESGTYSIIKK